MVMMFALYSAFSGVGSANTLFSVLLAAHYFKQNDGRFIMALAWVAVSATLLTASLSLAFTYAAGVAKVAA